jgi:hypothetical protein
MDDFGFAVKQVTSRRLKGWPSLVKLTLAEK